MIRTDSVTSRSSMYNYNFGDINDLILAIRDKNPRVRKWAIENIRNKELSAERAFPLLIDALKDENRDVRLQAVCALNELGRISCTPIEKLADKAVPALAKLLRNEKEDFALDFWTAQAFARFALMNPKGLIEIIRGI